MNLFGILGIATGTFLLLHVWAKRLEVGTTGSTWTARVYSLITFSRTLALLIAITYGVFLLAIFIGRIASPMTVAELGAYIGVVRTMQEIVQNLAGVWSTIILISILLGLSVLVFRTGKKHSSDERFNIDRRASSIKKILDVLVSRGMLATIDRSSRAVLTIGFVLSCVSFVAVSGDIIGKSMRDTMIVPLEKLYIELSEEEALNNIEQFAVEDQQIGDSFEPSQEDESVFDMLAVAFEDAVGGGFAEVYRGTNVGANVSMRTLQTRKEILQAFSDIRASTTAEPRRFSEVGSLTVIEKEAVELYERTGEANPRTSLGRRFRGDIEASFSTQYRGSWESLKHRLINAGASFRTPANIVEFESRMFAQILGGAIDISVTPTTEIGIVGRELTVSLGGDVASQMYRTAYAWTLENLLTNGEIENAFRGVSERHVAAADVVRELSKQGRNATLEVPKVARVASKLKDRPPTIHLNSDLKVDHERLQRALALYVRSVPRIATSVRMKVPDAITDFDDLFPFDPKRSNSLRTSIARGPAFVKASEEVRRVAFLRARSYASLRGFAKIGGVLIGRSANDPVESLDFVSLDWHREGQDKIILELGRSDGKKIQVGPYSKPVVAQALVYAADGRPIAVTMIPAYPIQELRILLHPVLLDTPLGCRIINLDRFVDHFARTSTRSREFEARIQAQIASYSLAWFFRLVRGFEQDLIQYKNVPLTDERVLRVFWLIASEWVPNTFVEADLFDDPSIFNESLEQFDERLLHVMEICSVGSKSNEWVSCIEEESQRLESSVESWLRPPPIVVIRSGVRETNYSIDENLTFVELTRGELAPMRFMMQVAFGSEEERAAVEPWEFTTLAEEIKLAVKEGVVADPESLKTLETAREFTILQRLFRTAFEGQLGQHFPIERLVELSTVVLPEITERQTLRWSPQPNPWETFVNGYVGILEGISDETDEWTVELKRIARCVASLSHLGSEELDMDEMCNVIEFQTSMIEACDQGDKAACEIKEGMDFVNSWFSVAEMRIALGATTTEQPLRDGEFDSCVESSSIKSVELH